MNCANLRGDQWISNETINHLISKTNQTCQGGRLRSWTSSSDFLFSRQKHNIFNEYLASGGAELCLCRRCAGKNIFGFLSSKIWDFQFEIVWTFNLFKCQNTNSSLSPPPHPLILHQSHQGTVAAGLDSALQVFALLIRATDKRLFSLTNCGLHNR